MFKQILKTASNILIPEITNSYISYYEFINKRLKSVNNFQKTYLPGNIFIFEIKNIQVYIPCLQAIRHKINTRILDNTHTKS